MAIKRMNHAVLYVRDAEKTYEFYRDVFGFRVVMEMPGAKFLQAPDSDNDHDLGLFSIGEGGGPVASRTSDGRPVPHRVGGPDPRGPAGDRREDVCGGALTGATDHSTTKALYGRDPDGLEFEVCWIVPKELQTPEIEDGRTRMRPLDIDAEIERFGLQTVGGV